jgi:hypothetical protein
LPDFKKSLAASNFAAKPVFNGDRGMCLDYSDASLEAVVDGVYRVVYFRNCNLEPHESVLNAIDQLRGFAARVSGKH